MLAAFYIDLLFYTYPRDQTRRPDGLVWRDYGPNIGGPRTHDELILFNSQGATNGGCLRVSSSSQK